MTSATIQKWGNSHAIRIPKSLLESLKWNNGEKIKISAKGNRLILEQIPKSKRKTLEELLENFDSENYQPYEVDWGKPVGRELW